jgi:hypothetical protein
MQTMEQQATDQLVSAALQQAMTYETYRNFIDVHAANESSSGPEQSEALSNYTMLNQRRMKRLDKTLKLNETATDTIENFEGDVTWLILTETWCGDAAQSMPMMQKIAGLNKGITVKVILRDEHPEVMDQFLYNGSRSIPKLITVDNKTQKVIGEWGPRPTKATQMVNNYKVKHGSLTPEFKQDLQLWYTKDKGQNTAEDLLKLL